MMRACEDFKVGDVAEFGPLAVTAADIKSFAARFDPQPMHLDGPPSRTRLWALFESLGRRRRPWSGMTRFREGLA